ncbi:hypothetical protein ACKA0G_10060 [Priestia megaterium]|uniref:hypothetical protein n=1 Tax=Priestia megaterium TaxID=1404 RepID=UPI00389CE998
MIYLLPLVPREGVNFRNIPTDPATITGKQSGRAYTQVSDASRYTIRGIRVIPRDGSDVAVTEITYDEAGGSYVGVKVHNLKDTDAIVNIQVIEVSKYPPGDSGAGSWPPMF